MEIYQCTADDADELARMNKCLIDAEKSSNPMSIDELRDRMTGFLKDGYNAYFFVSGAEKLGYALVRYTSEPPYLRQFFIRKEYRHQGNGKRAFTLLLGHLGADTIDVDVLPWNEAGLKFWKSCGFTETCISMRLSKSPVI